MTNFDQLLKEKVESVVSPYKEVFWKRFAKKAGIKSGISGFKIALFSVAGAGLIGTSLYVGINNNHNPGSSDSVVVNEVPIACDSSVQLSLEAVDSAALYMTVQNKAAEITNHKTDTHKNCTIKIQKSKEKIFKKRESEDRSKWRILTIDTDTIKSNY